MNTDTYRELIQRALQGLSEETLREIAQFVFFIHQKSIDPDQFDDEIEDFLLREDLKQMSRDEERHMVEEADKLMADSHD